MTTQKQVNGVNVEHLSQTIDAIKVTPRIAKFKFSAKNQWTVHARDALWLSE